MRTYKYQNLWHGCVGAWCPSIDNSRSSVLTDFSPRKNHGTLTNMDPGTDWVASESKIALDFDATNDYVVLTQVPVTGPEFSLSCWFKVNDVTAYRTLICLAQSANNNQYFLLQTRGDVAGDPLEFGINAGGSQLNVRSPNSIVVGKWMHACAVERNATDHTCYLDCRSTNSVTSRAPGASTRATIGAFFGSALDGYFNGR